VSTVPQKSFTCTRRTCRKWGCNLKIRRAEQHEIKHYNGVHPLFGFITVPAVVAGVKTRYQVAVEYLGDGKGEPNYEAIAPKGLHFDEDGLHTILGTTQRDMLDRIVSLEECSERCGPVTAPATTPATAQEIHTLLSQQGTPYKVNNVPAKNANESLIGRCTCGRQELGSCPVHQAPATTLALPTVHLGGTAQCDLYEQLSDALASLRTAIVKVSNAEPNGRDYYPQSPTAIFRAIAEHQDRIHKLESVISELETIITHVADAAK
jgi:hypothetical protein